MAVKMPLVNVGPQISAMSARAMSLVQCGWQGGTGRGGGQKRHLQTFFMDQPVSHNLSRNLSCKNAKPQPAAKIAAS